MSENKKRPVIPYAEKSQGARILEVFLSFLKYGCFTFGGGYSIVAQIQKEYVEEKHWISDEELLDCTSVGRSMPGLMVANTSVLFGYRVAGPLGGILALLGITLPPILIMVVVTMIYTFIKDQPLVARAMVGVRAAVVPIIFSALLKLFKAGMKDVFCYCIAIASLLLCLFTPVPNVVIVILGAVLGLVYMEVRHAVS